VNYERAVLDWTTTANTFTIGTQAGAPGIARDIQITAPNILLSQDPTLPLGAATKQYVDAQSFVEPLDNKYYAWQGGATPGWVPTVDEAPLDGGQYVRESGGWVPASGGGLPADPVSSIQFNNAGVFGGSANFVLTAGGVPNIPAAANNAYQYNGINALYSTSFDTSWFIGGAGNYTGDEGYNICIGSRPGISLTTGDFNIGIGFSTLAAATTAGSNVGIGYMALSAVTTGVQSVGVGAATLLLSTTANNNTAVGYSALENVTGGNNVGIGHQAGTSLTTGENNTFLGLNAGSALTTESNTTIIGPHPGLAEKSNQVIIADGSGNIQFYVNYNIDCYMAMGAGNTTNTGYTNIGYGWGCFLSTYRIYCHSLLTYLQIEYIFVPY
jgi:hypothetical protein